MGWLVLKDYMLLDITTESLKKYWLLNLETRESLRIFTQMKSKSYGSNWNYSYCSLNGNPRANA